MAKRKPAKRQVKQLSMTERAQARIATLEKRLASEKSKIAITQRRDELKKQLRELSPRKGK